jgi:hypothetical protein
MDMVEDPFYVYQPEEEIGIARHVSVLLTGIDPG